MMELFEKEYSVGEVAEALKEEIHNLRHWQKQLGLPDRRNELNQRVYTQSDINTFKFVKELRVNENLSLKAIKKVLNNMDIIKEEAAATSEVAVVDNNYNTAIEKLKMDFFAEIDRAINKRNQEIKYEIQDLKTKIDYLERDRNNKLDEFISEWRTRNQRKSLIDRIFNK